MQPKSVLPVVFFSSRPCPTSFPIKRNTVDNLHCMTSFLFEKKKKVEIGDCVLSLARSQCPVLASLVSTDNESEGPKCCPKYFLCFDLIRNGGTMSSLPDDRGVFFIGRLGTWLKQTLNLRWVNESWLTTAAPKMSVVIVTSWTGAGASARPFYTKQFWLDFFIIMCGYLIIFILVNKVWWF